MLRKVGLVLVVALFGGAALAYAQGGKLENRYKVTGKAKPPVPASKKHPKPVGIQFNYTTSEVHGWRPSPVKTYSIGFRGGADNGQFFPKCTAGEINKAQTDSVCPKGSEVGHGSVHNNAGATANPSDKSIPCDLDLKIYNSGRHKAALYLTGSPPECAVTINQAIDARYVKAFGGKGTALEFDVPDNLLHPLPGIDNAVVDVKSTLPKKTTRVHGRKRGYFESTMRCKRGKQKIAVTFTSEAGQKSTVSDTYACRGGGHHRSHHRR
jgi:hypothetical protein